jgi:phosphoribosyl 1,2-cyclic phosphate phosphodiesterase
LKGKAILLGSGTSSGVPLIGCTCPVCRSNDPRNHRLRTSLWLEVEGISGLIDTGTDLRQQLLREGIRKIDFVLYTHAHADHIHGIDDIRPFTLFRSTPLPCYADPLTVEVLKVRFPYIAHRDPSYPSVVPNLEFIPFPEPFPFLVGGKIPIHPIEVDHGGEVVYGFRIGNLGYLTDVKAIPPTSLRILQGVEVLFLGVLREEPHPKHLDLKTALKIIEALGNPRTIFVHLGHEVDYQEWKRRLPSHCSPGYDGMRVGFTIL